MALGGGTFTVQNKELPGAYINFVSAANAASALSDRGICTMPLELDWGPEGEVFEVSSGDFQKNCLEIFGYDYTDEKLKGLRELFLNARTLYAYRLNSGSAKASNELAEAVYGGVKGNELKIAVAVNADDAGLFDVSTLLGSNEVDVQTVGSAEELVPNKYVKWKDGAVLSAMAAVPLTGGENGSVSGDAHQKYLDKIEAYSFNVMGAAVTDDKVKALYAAFNKRMREEMGIKFQLVLYRHGADYLGTVNVKNMAVDDVVGEAGLVYWVTGALAGCEVNRSLQNRIYDGKLEIKADYTQTELKKSVKTGEFVLHKVGGDLRVLADINSMVTFSDAQGEVFGENQTVRVIDQIANDIAVLFNTKYLGAVPNDKAGRVSLWSDIVKHHQQLSEIGAIEGFADSDVTVEQGNSKKSVVVTDSVTVANAMSKVYMTVTVA
ncbi:MAG: phage tail protein [Ruminococcaceae bacterium]|nr:phage tail protein [Oscillospiraceae bacterium]